MIEKVALAIPFLNQVKQLNFEKSNLHLIQHNISITNTASFSHSSDSYRNSKEKDDYLNWRNYLLTLAN
jgi:hypothetical protein